MVKMHFADKQTAFEYAMYMMLGSYFNKANCKNYLLEKKMYFHYLLQKDKEQIELEDICLRWIEKELVPYLLEEVWNQNVEVRFFPTKDPGVRDIQFHGENYSLRVKGIYRGKRNTIMKHQLWDREREVLSA